MINKSGDKIIGKMAIAPIGGKKIFNEYMIKSKIRVIRATVIIKEFDIGV